MRVKRIRWKSKALLDDLREAEFCVHQAGGFLRTFPKIESDDTWFSWAVYKETNQ